MYGGNERNYITFFQSNNLENRFKICVLYWNILQLITIDTVVRQYKSPSNKTFEDLCLR